MEFSFPYEGLWGRDVLEDPYWSSQIGAYGNANFQELLSTVEADEAVPEEVLAKISNQAIHQGLFPVAEPVSRFFLPLSLESQVFRSSMTSFWRSWLAAVGDGEHEDVNEDELQAARLKIQKMVEEDRFAEVYEDNDLADTFFNFTMSRAIKIRPLVAGMYATELFTAAEAGNTAEVERLLSFPQSGESREADEWKLHSDIEKENIRGDTPLIAAAERGHCAVVDLLLKAKASMHVSPRKNALLAAAAHGHASVVQQLVSAGASTEVESDAVAWEMPLFAAAASGHEAVVQRLLELRADARATGRGGQTALDVARRRGHTRVVQVLEGK